MDCVWPFLVWAEVRPRSPPSFHFLAPETDVVEERVNWLVGKRKIPPTASFWRGSTNVSYRGRVLISATPPYESAVVLSEEKTMHTFKDQKATYPFSYKLSCTTNSTHLFLALYTYILGSTPVNVIGLMTREWRRSFSFHSRAFSSTFPLLDYL